MSLILENHQLHTTCCFSISFFVHYYPANVLLFISFCFFLVIFDLTPDPVQFHRFNNTTSLNVYKPFCSSPPQPKLRIALLNACSIYNKSADIYNHILENSLHIQCLTETWINDGDISSSLLSSLLLPNYDLAQHYGRPISIRGGGIAIIKINSINLTPIKTGLSSSFECIGSVITSSYFAFKLFVFYRPPSSSISTLFTEF